MENSLIQELLKQQKSRPKPLSEATNSSIARISEKFLNTHPQLPGPDPRLLQLTKARNLKRNEPNVENSGFVQASCLLKVPKAAPKPPAAAHKSEATFSEQIQNEILSKDPGVK